MPPEQAAMRYPTEYPETNQDQQDFIEMTKNNTATLAQWDDCFDTDDSDEENKDEKSPQASSRRSRRQSGRFTPLKLHCEPEGETTPASCDEDESMLQIQIDDDAIMISPSQAENTAILSSSPAEDDLMLYSPPVEAEMIVASSPPNESINAKPLDRALQSGDHEEWVSLMRTISLSITFS